MAMFESTSAEEPFKKTPKYLKRRTWRIVPKRPQLSIQLVHPRQDSVILFDDEKHATHVSVLSDDHDPNIASRPAEDQRVSDISHLSVDQQRLPDPPETHPAGQSDDLLQDTAGSYGAPQANGTRPIDLAVYPEDNGFDFELFDFIPGCRLSRPFMMPMEPLTRQSTTISRQSVVSVELIADLVRSRRRTQDSDTLSPTCMPSFDLQQLYGRCIPQTHPAAEDADESTKVSESQLTEDETSMMPGSQPEQETVQLHESKERPVSIRRQSSRAHLQQKCSILNMDKVAAFERLDAAEQVLVETKSRLWRAKKDFCIREEHVRALEVHAMQMKKGMEEAMRNYTTTSKELAALKGFRWEYSPSVPAQVLSLRQRKIHGELKLQIRDLECKLILTMTELRCMEKTWKEAQASSVICTRDLEKQKAIIDDKVDELRVAEEAKMRAAESLDAVSQELVTMRERLGAVQRENDAPGDSHLDPAQELAEATKRAHRLSKCLDQAEADCELTRTKIRRMKHGNAAPDAVLQKKLMVARKELRDREELLGVVRQTNADLARKIADMEQQLKDRKSWLGKMGQART